VRSEHDIGAGVKRLRKRLPPAVEHFHVIVEKHQMTPARSTKAGIDGGSDALWRSPVVHHNQLMGNQQGVLHVAQALTHLLRGDIERRDHDRYFGDPNRNLDTSTVRHPR
jgi:hypothetical protein